MTSRPNFEEAYHQLEEAVTRLSAGGLALEESLRLFEQGTALANYCSTLLDQAELRVQQVGQLPPEELAALLDLPATPAITDVPTKSGRSAPPPATRPEPPARSGPLAGPPRRGGDPPPRPPRNPDFDALFDDEL